MIKIKTREEIEIMKEGGKILAAVLFEVMKSAKVGVSEIELDKLAEKLILAKGAEPGFKKVKGYNYTTCISTNDVVVHGIPTDYKLKENDVIGVDCGVYYKGFYTDMAQTKKVRSEEAKAQNKDETDKFLETGENAMWKAIRIAKEGRRVGDISKAIQDEVEAQGYSVVRSLVGHGVGKELHEEPEIPGFLNKPISETPLLKENMTLAIEVIYNMGKSEVVYAGGDNWTIATGDGSLSGLFERTIMVTKKHPKVITQ